MLKKTVFCFAMLLFMFTGVDSAFAEEDVEGSEDHPMISRYGGSYIHGYERYDYDRIVFAKREDGDIKEVPVEGKATRILYIAPEGLSSLQVHRNYQVALQNAGFEIIQDEIDEGQYNPFFEYNEPIDGHSDIFHGQGHQYLLARHSQTGGDLYVSAHTVLGELVDDRPVTALQILEEKPLETGMVQVDVNARAMAEGIDEEGGVRIYGIHFDTDEATIQEGSESTLNEIAKLLEQNPELKLGVVGHTDATGEVQYNMDLSKQRAEAVVELLSSEHGVSADRLNPYGAGPLAPIASNADEDGRARNRRVELIELPED